MSARLLTARQVAGELGVSPRTVLRWHREGKLPGVKLSSSVLRFDRDDLDAFKRASRTGPTIAVLRAVDRSEGL